MAETEQKNENASTQVPQQAKAAPAPRTEERDVSKADVQQYTFTDEGVVIEAVSLEEAIKKLNAQKEENK